MKFPKFVINSFAVLGVISLFLYTCAAADIDEINNTTNNLPINSGGIYQVSRAGGDGSLIVVLNTETGVMKTYRYNANANGWSDSSQYQEITFTH
jgi:hypothetical protein